MALVGRPLNNLGYRDPEPRPHRQGDLHSVSTESQSIRLEAPETYQITPSLKDSYFQQTSYRLTPATSIRTAQHKPLAVPYDQKNMIRQSSFKTAPELKTYSLSGIRPVFNLKDLDGKTEPAFSPLQSSALSPDSPFQYHFTSGSPMISTKRVSHLMAFNGVSNLYSPQKTQTPSRQMVQRHYEGMDNSAVFSQAQVGHRSPLLGSLGLQGQPKNPMEGKTPTQGRHVFPSNPLATHLKFSHQAVVMTYPEQCKCKRSQLGTCELAESWKSYIIKKPHDEFLLRNAYLSCLKQPKKPEDEQQIEKDVLRTYPDLDVYHENSPATRKLSDVLAAISVKFPAIGYVQGMNFICASMIFHLKEEYLTFGVFSYLVEFLNLQDVFKEGSLPLRRIARITVPLSSADFDDETEASGCSRSLR